MNTLLSLTCRPVTAEFIQARRFRIALAAKHAIFGPASCSTTCIVAVLKCALLVGHEHARRRRKRKGQSATARVRQVLGRSIDYRVHIHSR